MTRAPARAMPGPVIGIDAGSVRVGVAASDPTRTVATPVVTLQRTSAEFWARLGREIEARAATSIVVGLPRRLDGSEGEAAASARRLAADVERRTGLAAVLWDERFTTAQAERHMIAAGVRRRGRRARIDAVAATLMLQSWLDADAARARDRTEHV
jgi:putative Holliday junction resolvase